MQGCCPHRECAPWRRRRRCQVIPWLSSHQREGDQLSSQHRARSLRFPSGLLFVVIVLGALVFHVESSSLRNAKPPQDVIPSHLGTRQAARGAMAESLRDFDSKLPPSFRKAKEGRVLQGRARILTPQPSDTQTAMGVTKLAVDLLQGTGNNTVLSPFSVYVALAMLTGGAAGDTLSQLLNALNARNITQLSAGLATVLEGISAEPSTDSSGNRTVFDVANNVWVDDGFPLKQTFRQLMLSTYGVLPQAVKFQFEAEAIRQEINSWVSNKTRGKIVDLLPPGALTPLTRLVLVNALYFKAPWMTAFNPRLTSPEPFLLSRQTAVDVPMMKQYDIDGSVHSLCGNPGSQVKFSVLRLPYNGTSDKDADPSRSYAMYIFLPDEVDGLVDLVDELTPEQLNRCFAMSEGSQSMVKITELRIPRFRATSPRSLPLKSVLRSVGIVDAFDPDVADLSGMSVRSSGLYVSGVFHKAFLEVNEQGSQAAAATGVTISDRSGGPLLPSVQFIADHPFLYLIRDPFGNIIIMGEMQDPGM